MFFCYKVYLNNDNCVTSLPQVATEQKSLTLFLLMFPLRSAGLALTAVV